MKLSWPFRKAPAAPVVAHRAPVGGGVNVEAVLQAARSWRDQFNPLRGLTIARAVSLMEAAQRGQLAELQWTYKFIEDTHPTAFALVERRTSALLEMDWNIHQVAQEDAGAGYSKALAEDQALALRAAYEGIDNLYEAIEHLALASFRMYAHLQPHFNGDAIAHLEPLNQWNFARDGMFGGWAWNPEAQDLAASRLPAANQITAAHRLIVRVVPRHVNRIALIQFIRASMGQKDWDSFVEIYGLPRPIIIMPADVPPDKVAEYEAAADDVAEGGGGSLPNGSEVKYPTEARGSSPFAQYLEFLERQLVLVGTGGLLTMLTESGSGTLAGNAHADTFKTIARAEARKISEILQRSIDAHVLDTKFSGRPRLAYFAMAAQEERDVGDIVDHTQKLALAGYQVDVADLAERTGYKLTLKPEPAPAPGFAAGGFHRALHRAAPDTADGIDARKTDALIDAGAEALVAAQDAEWRAVAERIMAAANAPTVEAGLEILKQLQAEQPEILARMLADDSPVARAYEDAMSAALLNGYALGAAKRSGTP